MSYMFVDVNMSGTVSFLPVSLEVVKLLGPGPGAVAALA